MSRKRKAPSDESPPAATSKSLKMETANEDADYKYDGTGGFINRMLDAPSTRPNGKKGRPKTSGRDKLRDKSGHIKGKSTTASNPAAEALDLGPCLLAPVDNSGNRINQGRPEEKLTQEFAEGRKSSYAKSYHITWAAKNGHIPTLPGGVQTEYSHRCHQKTCVNEDHGIWELGKDNKARERCKASNGGSHQVRLGAGGNFEVVSVRCPHDPPCLSAASVVA